MLSNKHWKTLAVRLPEPELRRFKSLAASRGVTVQNAVHQALEAWSRFVPKAPVNSLDNLQGSLADVDVDKIRGEEKEAELAKEGLLLNG